MLRGKILLPLFIAGSLLVVSCAGTPEAALPEPEVESIPPEVTNEVAVAPVSTILLEVEEPTDRVTNIDDIQYPTDTASFVIGGPYIEGYYAGGRAEFQVKVYHNGSEPAEYQAEFKYPDPKNLTDGFAFPPRGINNWVEVWNSSLILEPGEEGKFNCTLEVPIGIELPDKWEFWIAIKDIRQESFVQLETCRRVLVETR